jgi:hypothetical protein
MREVETGLRQRLIEHGEIRPSAPDSRRNPGRYCCVGRESRVPFSRLML